MSAHALVTGTLYRDLVMRTSKTGKPFVTATIRASGEAVQWWRSLMCNAAHGEAMLRIKKRKL